MGLGGISIWQLLIVLAIIVLLFGTKKLRNMGGDLGSAVKGFKKAINDESNADKAESTSQDKIAATDDEQVDTAEKSKEQVK